MPSKAVYTALAAARSDTGCNTVLIPWVEEPVMVTPEVVGRHRPGVYGRVKTNGEGRNRQSGATSAHSTESAAGGLHDDIHDGHARAAWWPGASRSLVGLVNRFIARGTALMWVRHLPSHQQAEIPYISLDRYIALRIC